MALAVPHRVTALDSRKSLPKLVESPAGPPKIFGRVMTPVFPRSAERSPSKTPALDLARAKTDPKLELLDVTRVIGGLDHNYGLDDDGEEVEEESDDDDLDEVQSRQKKERAAEFEIAHNWLLKEETEIQAKKFIQTKRKLTICLPDDDPLEGINNRLEEVQSMVKPKVELSDFLEELDPEQRERIYVSFKRLMMKGREGVVGRKRWWGGLLLSFWRYSLQCQLSNFDHRKSPQVQGYFNPDDPEAGPATMRKQRQFYRKSKQSAKASLSSDLQDVLWTNPMFRTAEHIKRVTWLLKTTKAFKHCFPTEMIEEVAKVLAYERYDDNRHIAYQGRPPERFYYVLTGRIHKLREYKLTSGCVNKPMGFMHKGFTSDPEELEHGWNRECHLVAKGPVEVLILAKDDFIRLQHTTQGPPIDFLYQNRLITRDVNRTPWLHVVKSGYVKVVRRQSVVDVSDNTTKFQARTTEELGCGRSFSHAKGKRGGKDMMHRLMRRRSTILIDEGMRGNRKRRPTLKLTTPIIREMSGPKTEESETNGQSESSTNGQKSKKDLTLPPIIVTSEELPTESQSGKSKGSGHSKEGRASPPKGVSVSMPTSLVNTVQEAVKMNGMQPHGLFLTREKTQAEVDAMFQPRKPKKEVTLRRTCIQLDLLKPGDVFGLEDIAKKFRYQERQYDEGLETLDLPTIQKFEGPPLALVSDGAEVIKISKRFFLQHAQNNTMLRVETMQRSYLTTDEAKDILYNKETWGQYKEALMKRLIASLPT
ncbi:cyclic nucleotide-binding domain-containing protein 2-like [Plakobranchus ocellatus]|uniref:Cyclic nucleotide-binding domain-containing protein 2-like n=1 Tax=Plakobranchus ocellatus TaxID=259542 RepID=A0AAV4AHM1_9GAST|nr:cyclic nucleotide-binding domain-containing protein 2-like [Plakobranchus ocellatus]